MLNAINAKGERVSLTARVVRRRFSKKLKSLPEDIEEEGDDVAFLLWPFMKEWGCLDSAEIERGFSAIDRMGIIDVPGVPPE